MASQPEVDLSTFEALWPPDLFEEGIGWVILARFKPNGRRVEAGVFLVDIFCLGVKLAIFEGTERADYQQRIRGHYVDKFALEQTDPCCARKLLEQAAAYAAGLGFAAHPGYEKAMRYFRAISSEPCAREFTFGHQGKPFYRRGPRENEAQAAQIVARLEQRCGPGNFHYLVRLGEGEELR